MAHVFIYTAVNGKLDIGSQSNQARLNDLLKLKEGKKFRLELVENKRSLSINARYWAYLADIEAETGNLSTDTHEVAKRLLLPPTFVKVKIKGQVQEIKRPTSTAELTTVQFMDYLDKLQAWCGVHMRTAEELGYTPMNER